MADQDRKATALYLILANQVSNFYHGFYNALDIFSPKTKMLSQWVVIIFENKNKCNWFLARHMAVTVSRGLNTLIHISILKNEVLIKICKYHYYGERDTIKGVHIRAGISVSESALALSI